MCGKYGSSLCLDQSLCRGWEPSAFSPIRWIPEYRMFPILFGRLFYFLQQLLEGTDIFRLALHVCFSASGKNHVLSYRSWLLLDSIIMLNGWWFRFRDGVLYLLFVCYYIFPCWRTVCLEFALDFKWTDICGTFGMFFPWFHLWTNKEVFAEGGLFALKTLDYWISDSLAEIRLPRSLDRFPRTSSRANILASYCSPFCS